MEIAITVRLDDGASGADIARAFRTAATEAAGYLAYAPPLEIGDGVPLDGVRLLLDFVQSAGIYRSE